jgi:hypothetical protein
MAGMKVNNPPARNSQPLEPGSKHKSDVDTKKAGAKVPKPGTQTADSSNQPVTPTKTAKTGSTGAVSGNSAKGATQGTKPGVTSGKAAATATQGTTTQATAAGKQSPVDAAYAKVVADKMQYDKDFKSKDQNKLMGDLGTLSTDLQALSGLVTGEQSAQQTKTNLDKLFGSRGAPSADDVAKIKNGTPADAMLALVARRNGAFLKQNITQDNSTKPPQYTVQLYKDGKPMPVKVPAGGTWVNVYQQAIKKAQDSAGPSLNTPAALQSLITGQPAQAEDALGRYEFGVGFVAPFLLAKVQAGTILATTSFQTPAATGPDLTKQMTFLAQTLRASLQETSQTVTTFDANRNPSTKNITSDTITLPDGKSTLRADSGQFVYTNPAGKAVTLTPGTWNLLGADPKTGLVTASQGTGSRGNVTLPLEVFRQLSKDFTVGPVPGTAPGPVPGPNTAPGTVPSAPPKTSVP